MPRFCAALTTALAFLLVGGNARADDYRVVATGDSILDRVAPLLPDDWLIDTEGGRQPFTAGLDGRMSTVEAVALLASEVEPGGWIIVQDGGSASVDVDDATPGPQTLDTDELEWTEFVQAVIALAPDDVCLLWVLPGYAESRSHEKAVEAWRRSLIVRENIDDQPCAALVDWNAAVTEHPDWVDDGLHLGAGARR